MESILVDALVSCFLDQGGYLLFGADEEEEGTLKIKTSCGAHLTANCVLDELQRRETKKVFLLVSVEEQNFREPPSSFSLLMS